MIIIGGKRPWPWFHTTLFPDMRTSIIKIRGLSDRLIFIMGIILLVIFSTETVPSLWRLRRRRWVNISMILYRQFYPHLLKKKKQLVRYTINQPALRIQPLMKLLCIYIYIYMYTLLAQTIIKRMIKYKSPITDMRYILFWWRPLSFYIHHEHFARTADILHVLKTPCDIYFHLKISYGVSFAVLTDPFLCARVSVQINASPTMVLTTCFK